MKQALIILISTTLFFNSAYASCWSSRDKAELEIKELDGDLTFSIRDAVTCKPVANAVMTIGKVAVSVDQNGEARIERPDGIMEATIPFTIEKKGYFTLKDTFNIEAGRVNRTRFLMSEIIPLNSIRFVLDWLDEPLDLDLHVKSDNFHVSYRNMHNYQNQVKLDTDAQDGWGAETITMGKVNNEKVYSVYVSKYSKEMMVGLDKNVKVSVYYNGRLDKVVRLPATNSDKVKILEIKQGNIRYLNSPVDSF